MEKLKSNTKMTTLMKCNYQIVNYNIVSKLEKVRTTLRMYRIKKRTE